MTAACACNSVSISDHVSNGSSQASDSGNSNSNKVSERTQERDQRVSTRSWGAVSAAMAQQKQPLWPSVHGLRLKSLLPRPPALGAVVIQCKCQSLDQLTFLVLLPCRPFPDFSISYIQLPLSQTPRSVSVFPTWQGVMHVGMNQRVCDCQQMW